jgi:hypothetical protein
LFRPNATTRPIAQQEDRALARAAAKVSRDACGFTPRFAAGAVSESRRRVGDVLTGLAARRRQCEIIQGRAVGNDLAPSGRSNVALVFAPGRQQLQLEGCKRRPRSDPDSAGSCEARSLVASAERLLTSMQAKAGITKNARDDGSPHSGHSQGSSDFAIGRVSRKGPQDSQS